MTTDFWSERYNAYREIADSGNVTYQQLCEAWGLAYSSVSQCITRLRDRGYDIQINKNHGKGRQKGQVNWQRRYQQYIHLRDEYGRTPPREALARAWGVGNESVTGVLSRLKRYGYKIDVPTLTPEEAKRQLAENLSARKVDTARVEEIETFLRDNYYNNLKWKLDQGHIHAPLCQDCLKGEKINIHLSWSDNYGWYCGHCAWWDEDVTLPPVGEYRHKIKPWM